MFSERVQETRAERKRRTATRIIEAAGGLFRERGFQGTTVRQIAAEANVSVGAVMAVGDKESLLSLVYDQAIAARVPASAAGSAASAVDYLAHYFDPFLDLFTENEELARSYFRALTRGRPESAALGGLRTLAEGDLTAAMVRAGIPGPLARHGAQVMFTSYLGELMMLAAGSTDRRQTAAGIRRTAEFVTACAGNDR
ncbi:TetR/AcrR family transcriptional regulator [Streptomyces barkulensis]|uniref:TetR/AcrR family transcriptional regulator n=1 Tax=Streptomyces barkulensis TaxID=1257026 RepID=UPI000C6E50E1|nr:TetR/AcrR family transcriptional regulator [Streptomyces barkulensis]